MTLPSHPCGALLLMLGANMLSVAPSHASDALGGTLWLKLPDCATPPYQTEKLVHALDVELGPERLRAQVENSTASASGPRVVLHISSCDPQADSLTLLIWSADGRALGARSIELGQIEPAARARTVALVVTDALRPPRLPASEAPFEASSALEADPFGPTPAPASEAHSWPPVHDDPLPETDDPYPTSPSLRVGVGLHARLITRNSNLLLGFEASARGRLIGATEWAVEGSFSRGDTWTPLRDLELTWWNGAVGVDLVASDAPHFSLGPRLALARVDGSSSEDEFTQERAVVMTLGARANLSSRLGRGASLSATLEASHSLYETPLSERGEYLPWYGWALTWGIGVSFGP